MKNKKVCLYNNNHVIQRLIPQLVFHDTNRMRHAAAVVCTTKIEHQRTDRNSSLDYRKKRKIKEQKAK